MDCNIITTIGLFISFGMALLFIYKKMKDGFGSYNLKVFGITLIVFASLIVLQTGLSAEKTAACFGIFGSIGGYLFGIKEDK